MSLYNNRAASRLSIEEAKTNPTSGIAKSVGELFAKPFCRFAAMIGVFFLLFGIIAVVDDPGSNFPFFFVNVTLALTFLCAGLTGSGESSEFSENSGSLTMIGVVGFALAIMFTLFVVSAPSEPVPGQQTTTFTPYSKGMAGFALGYGGFILVGFFNYIHNYSENVDQYVFDAITESSPLYGRAIALLTQRYEHNLSHGTFTNGKDDLDILNAFGLNYFTKRQIALDMSIKFPTAFVELGTLIEKESKGEPLS